MNESDLIDIVDTGDIEKVRSSLDGGADVNARDRDGNSALYWASYKGYADIISLLLERGANVN